MTSDPIPDRWLERYVAGALDPARTRRIDEARAADPALARRIEAIESSNAEILARYPPADVRRRVLARLRPDPIRWPGVSAVGLALAAAVALLVARSPRPAATDPPSEAPSERIKGLAPQLHLYRDGERAPLADGARARAGDVLQIAFVRGPNEHGAILAVDGRGDVTVHARELPRSEASGEVALDQALMLDDAPAFERFFLVTCPGPFDVDALTDDARALARDPARARVEHLPTPAACAQVARLLVKEAAP